MIAVNPSNDRNRIAVWMDRTDGNVNTAYTTDGGKSWTQSVPSGVDQCTGDTTRPWEAAGDPWVSFGPDGVAYFASLTWANFENPPFSDYVSVLHVQTSFDGGRTWTLPVTVGRDDYTSDKDSIAADPNHPGTVYATWRNDGFGLVFGAAGARQLLFSKSVDWGHTWSAPTVISDQTASNLRLGNPQVVAVPDGTVVVTSSLPGATGAQQLLSFRSTDGGATWSAGTGIRTNGPAAAPSFNVCGENLAAGGGQPGQTATLGRHGVAIISLDRAAYAAGHGWQIVLSRSSDSGQSWSSQTVVRSSNPISFPSVAGRPDGQLGILWDETNVAGTDCANGVEPQRTRFTASNGDPWSSPRSLGAAWWNAYGLDLGDYHSLAPTQKGFTTIAPQGPALTSGPRNPSITGDDGVVVSDIATGS
jgi:hypothetical protein